MGKALWGYQQLPPLGSCVPLLRLGYSVTGTFGLVWPFVRPCDFQSNIRWFSCAALEHKMKIQLGIKSQSGGKSPRRLFSVRQTFAISAAWCDVPTWREVNSSPMLFQTRKSTSDRANSRTRVRPRVVVSYHDTAQANGAALWRSAEAVAAGVRA